jgi:hypothetical protein
LPAKRELGYPSKRRIRWVKKAMLPRPSFDDAGESWPPEQHTRRSRWWLWFPFVLLVVVAAGWTGGWFYAASLAEKKIEEWRAREAERGRVFACGSQTIGGYPFRLELHCTAPRAELRTQNLSLKAADMLGVVQVYRPTHGIGEFTGPLTIQEPGGSLLIANWKLAQASVSGLPAAERISIVLDAATVDRTVSQVTSALFTANRVEAHSRLAPRLPSDPPVVDLALQLAGATAPNLHPITTKPVNADITATARGVKDLSPKPWLALLRDWQAAGGSLDVTKARLQQDDMIVVGDGTLALNARGALDGQLRITVVGLEKLVAALGVSLSQDSAVGRLSGALDRVAPGLGNIARERGGPNLLAAGVGMLGQKTDLEGKPAVTLPLRFADGAVFFGPLKVGQIAPVF